MHNAYTEQAQWLWGRMRGQTAGSGLPSTGAFPHQVWAQVPGGTRTFSQGQDTTQQVGLSNPQTWGAGTEWYSRLFRGRQWGRWPETTWFILACRESHSQPEIQNEETGWDTEMVAVIVPSSHNLEPGAYQHLHSKDFWTNPQVAHSYSGTVVLREANSKGPRGFLTSMLWSRTTAKDQGRPGKRGDLQEPPTPAPPQAPPPLGTCSEFTSSGLNHTYPDFDGMGLFWKSR